MAIDSIVAEVRRAREAYAKQFNYDVQAMWRDLQARQHKSGRTVVALSPKRMEPIPQRWSEELQEPPNQGMVAPRKPETLGLDEHS
jgi:hypothetical protein